jgi:hypothetical protein
LRAHGALIRPTGNKTMWSNTLPTVRPWQARAKQSPNEIEADKMKGLG